MEENSQIIVVFTGSELVVKLLKEELEQIGISSIIQNSFNSCLVSGFSGGLPSGIELSIHESDMEKAEPIIKDFIQRNND